LLWCGPTRSLRAASLPKRSALAAHVLLPFPGCGSVTSGANTLARINTPILGLSVDAATGGHWEACGSVTRRSPAVPQTPLPDYVIRNVPDAWRH
jgi:hypothetical protein